MPSTSSALTPPTFSCTLLYTMALWEPTVQEKPHSHMHHVLILPPRSQLHPWPLSSFHHILLPFHLSDLEPASIFLSLSLRGRKTSLPLPFLPPHPLLSLFSLSSLWPNQLCPSWHSESFYQGCLTSTSLSISLTIALSFQLS